LIELYDVHEKRNACRHLMVRRSALIIELSSSNGTESYNKLNPPRGIAPRTFSAPGILLFNVTSYFESIHLSIAFLRTLTVSKITHETVSN
jgi:hypothetical protein